MLYLEPEPCGHPPGFQTTDARPVVDGKPCSVPALVSGDPMCISLRKMPNTSVAAQRRLDAFADLLTGRAFGCQRTLAEGGIGAGCQNRTDDLLITNQLLYQLS